MHTKKRNQNNRQALMAWLETHPEIESRLERMRELTGVDSTHSVDEFEEQMLKEIDELSQDLLRHWLLDKESIFLSDAIKDPRLRKHSKKNCKSIAF